MRKLRKPFAVGAFPIRTNGSLLRDMLLQPAQSSRVSREKVCRQRRAAEFREKVAPILVPFVYGPDYYGYFSERITIGALGERNILVRVVDDSLYPPEWKQFMRWKQHNGLYNIVPHIIVEDD